MHCMLAVDLEIIYNTNGKDSLHSVMKELYDDFALKDKGYSEDDFRNICVKFGGIKVAEIFENHIYGTEDYIPSLKSALEVVGVNLKEKKNQNLSAQYFGFISIKENGKVIIKKVEPNSETDRNGIAPEDEIVKVNGKEIEENLTDILKSCKNKVTFTIKKKFSEKDIVLKIGNYYSLLELERQNNASEDQLILRKVWSNN